MGTGILITDSDEEEQQGGAHGFEEEDEAELLPTDFRGLEQEASSDPGADDGAAQEGSVPGREAQDFEEAEDLREPHSPEPATDEEWERLVVVMHHRETYVRKFHMYGYQTEFALLEDLVDEESMQATLERLIQRQILEAEESAEQEGFGVGWIGLAFVVEGMREEFLVPFRPKAENNAHKLATVMAEFDQSDNGIQLFGNRVAVKVTVIRQPVGAGRRKGSKNLPKGRAPKAPKRQRGRPRERPEKGLNIDPNALLRVPEADDNLCLFKAVCIALAYAGTGHNKTREAQLLQGNPDRLRSAAKELMKNARIDSDSEEYGTPHLERVQDYLQRRYPNKYRILVFAKHYDTAPYFKGSYPSKHLLTLYNDAGHFHAVKSPAKLFGGRYYCDECESTYGRATHHSIRCPVRCPECCRMGYGFPCKNPDNTPTISCNKCKKSFQTLECYDAHLGSACKDSRKCLKCGIYYATRHGHDCNLRYCKEHKEYDECWQNRSKSLRNRHIKPIDDFPDKDYRIVAYDIECKIYRKSGPNRTAHDANFLSAYVTCNKCIESGGAWNKKHCPRCGPVKRKVFSEWQHGDVIKEFAEWVLRGDESMDDKARKKWQQYTTLAFAHNGARYDSHFILRELYNRQGVAPKVTSNGNKLIEVSLRRTKTTAAVYFRDSVLPFPMKLASVPDAFGLKIDPKGHFPHRANKEDNYGIVLPQLPDLNDYIPGSMNKKERVKFEKWHTENQYKLTFDLCKQLEEYCCNDSWILINGLIKFRERINEKARCDIFSAARTITGLCLRLYKKSHLSADTLHNLPHGGYNTHERQSREALHWLKWLAAKHGIHIQHRDSHGGEVKIERTQGKPYLVDGYITAEEFNSAKFTECNVTEYECPVCVIKQKRKLLPSNRDVVIEYHGDLFHGCPHGCYPDDIMCPNGRTSDENLQRTRQRQVAIERIGNVEYGSIHSCQVQKELKVNAQMKEFFEQQCWDSSPLDPRDGFFGGRVHPTRMYSKPEPGEEIKHFDVVSLYPYVLRKEYPVGEAPSIITWKDLPGGLHKPPNWKEGKDLPYKGLYKVRVLPPKDLFFPVLPLRDDQRLLFALCRKCAEESRKASPYKDPSPTDCTHSEKERAFVTTTTHIELADALDHGYRILNFIEAWHYPEWSDQVFKEYMNDFLRDKIEASGWKPSILNAPDPEAAKDAFIAEYKQREGIVIRKEHVELNPGRRSVAKLALNSLWGRFAMRPSQAVFEIVRKPSRLTELLDKKSIYVMSIIELNEESLRVEYKYKKRFEKHDENSNIVVAIYTTAYGRMELLGYMRDADHRAGGAQGSRLLYNDTDSIIVVGPKDQIPIKVGRFLGEMEDEHPGVTIEEFICGGNKNYGMRVRDKDGNMQIAQKVRGITFTSQAERVLSYETMKEMVLSQPNQEPLLVPTERIAKDKRSNVFTRTSNMRYQVGTRKGWIDSSLRLRPYGFTAPLPISAPSTPTERSTPEPSEPHSLSTEAEFSPPSSPMFFSDDSSVASSPEVLSTPSQPHGVSRESPDAKRRRLH